MDELFLLLFASDLIEQLSSDPGRPDGLATGG